MLICKLINTTATYIVRHQVLRKGKPIETCVFDGDNLESTFHIGCFDGDLLVGVVSVYETRNADFEQNNQYQLRGMAVLDNYQKKGIGNDLLRMAELLIKPKNGNLIWFNARENAVGFYQKMGYSISGQPFDIVDIGQHFVMFKSL